MEIYEISTLAIPIYHSPPTPMGRLYTCEIVRAQLHGAHLQREHVSI